MRAKRIGGGRANLRQLPPQPSAMASRHFRQPTDSEAHSDCTVPETSSGDEPNRRSPELAPKTTGETVEVAEESCAPQAINEPKDCLEMDWTQKEVCIKCDKGGKLLVCCDSNCPVAAMHEECMHCLPQFDSMGDFYCPYCSYKRAMLETRKARKRAILAKKALSVFLDKEMVNGDPCKKKAVRVKWTEPNLAEVVGDTVCDTTTRNRLDGDEVDNHLVQMEEDQREKIFVPESTSVLNLQNGTSCSREEDIGHRFETIQVEKSVQAEHPELVDDLQNKRVLQDEEQAEPLSASLVQKETKLDCAIPISTQGELNNSGVFKEHEGRRTEEEAMQDQVQGTTLSSSGDRKLDGALPISTQSELNNSGVVKEHEDRRPEEAAMQDQVQGTTVSSGGDNSKQQEYAKDSYSSDGGSGDVSPRWRHIEKKSQSGVQSPIVDCPRRSASNNVVQKEKKNPKNKSRQLITSPNVPHGRRKKLPWTDEEEEMLKEGVQKFSAMVNKNLPWRKILEFGHHVFDGTRTPVDLKDKWRNILVKESSPK
ncbi:hypothetical protein U1Q18_024316 [Sarracenia purpurea var. burkii]